MPGKYSNRHVVSYESTYNKIMFYYIFVWNQRNEIFIQESCLRYFWLLLCCQHCLNTVSSISGSSGVTGEINMWRSYQTNFLPNLAESSIYIIGDRDLFFIWKCHDSITNYLLSMWIRLSDWLQIQDKTSGSFTYYSSLSPQKSHCPLSLRFNLLAIVSKCQKIHKNPYNM